MLQTLFGPIFVNTLLIAIILIVLKSSWKEVIFFKSSIIKPTTLNINKQKAIGDIVADLVTCIISIPPKYQHVVSSLDSEK